MPLNNLAKRLLNLGIIPEITQPSGGPGSIPALRELGYSAEKAAPGNVFNHVFPTAFTAAALQTAIASLGVTKGTVHCNPGTWAISSAVVVPANVALRVEPGAVLTKSTGGTLNVGGPLLAPAQQIFSGFAAGELVVGGPNEALPQWWGAKGDGVTDDTDAIQTMIDVLAGWMWTDPAAHTRTLSCPIRFPAGDYRVSAPLRFWSIQAMQVRGAAYDTTRVISTAAVAAVLDLNGTAYSHFRDFSVGAGGDGADVLIHVRWDNSVAARSSTHNTFEGVWGYGKFKVGYKVGTDGSALQEDQTCWVRCRVDGDWSAGETTWWQAGYKLGTGVVANCLIHSIFHIAANHCRRGLHVSATQCSVMGGIIQSNEVDVYTSGITGYFSVHGIRSEGSGRFHDSPGTEGTQATASFTDIAFRTDGLHADSDFFLWHRAGTLYLRNFQIGTEAAAPTFNFSAGPYKMTVDIDGVAVSGAGYATTTAGLIKCSRNVSVNVRGLYADNGSFQGTVLKGQDGQWFGPSGDTGGDFGLSQLDPDVHLYRDLTTGEFRVEPGDGGLSLGKTGKPLGFGGTAPLSKPTVTGSRGSNAALASLLTALANLGLLTDSSS